MAKNSHWFGALLVCVAWLVSQTLKAEPIHDAALDGDADRVEQLLREGADVNAPDPAGTPLQWALCANQESIARLLLENGADPNVEGAAASPLLTATIGGNTMVIKLLLDHGADPNRGDRSTPLVAAAWKENLEIIELLLEYGADPNLTTSDGTAPLHEAASKGHLEIARRLVEHGADVNAVTMAGKPPIHFALVGNHSTLAAYLRARGAAPGEIAPIADLLASADLAQGESAAEVCAGCHHLDKVLIYRGPSLWNVVGRPMARVSEFDYSPAFAALEGIWTYDALNQFLARPFETVPGTKMNFLGEPDPQKRANLIAYLRTLSDDPLPLP